MNKIQKQESDKIKKNNIKVIFENGIYTLLLYYFDKNFIYCRIEVKTKKITEKLIDKMILKN